MRTKLIFYLAISMIFEIQVFGQKLNDTTIVQSEIVGIWQYGTSRISSTLHRNFQFFNNGNFVFNLDGYDDLNPLYSIYGKYSIERGVLNLRIVKYKAQTGFKVTDAEHSFQFGSFQLVDGKTVVVEQNEKESSPHEIIVLAKKGVPGTKVIKIDGDKYFKLSSDPYKFISK